MRNDLSLSTRFGGSLLRAQQQQSQLDSAVAPKDDRSGARSDDTAVALKCDRSGVRSGAQSGDVCNDQKETRKKCFTLFNYGKCTVENCPYFHN